MSNDNIEKRKKEHIEICLRKNVANRKNKGLKKFSFMNVSLPNLHYDEISLEIDFLNYKTLPFLISAMTGATPHYNLNEIFCNIASKTNTPLVLGSFKALFALEKEYKKQFDLKKNIPLTPLIANIGLFEFKNNLKTIKEIVEKMNFDALSIHLNTGQERIQINGDKDFLYPFELLKKVRDTLKIPLIVKETGFGFHPLEVKKILDLGFDFVDLACCGCNWMLVEGERKGGCKIANAFDNWGYDLGTMLIVLNSFLKENDFKRIIASGGIEDGVDIAKCIALNAKMTGFASSFLKRVLQDPLEIDKNKCIENGINFIEELREELKIAMLLNGAKTIEELRKKEVLIDMESKHNAEEILKRL